MTSRQAVQHGEIHGLRRGPERLNVDFQFPTARQPDGERVLGTVAERLKAAAAVVQCLKCGVNNGTFHAAAGEAAQDIAVFGDQHGGAEGPRHGAAGAHDGRHGAALAGDRGLPVAQRRHQIQHGYTSLFPKVRTAGRTGECAILPHRLTA
jgi:hypothetical protein